MMQKQINLVKKKSLVILMTFIYRKSIGPKPILFYLN